MPCSGCVEQDVAYFLFGGDRELVFLARSHVTGRHDSEPSCAEGDAFPLTSLVGLFLFSFFLLLFFLSLILISSPLL